MKRFISILFFIVLIAAAVIFFVTTFWTESFYEEGKNYLIIEGEVIKDANEPILEDGNILIPFDVIKTHIDSTAHWDEKVKTAVFTTKDKLIKMKTDKLTAMINRKPMDLNIPTRIVDDIPYIPIEFLNDIFDIDIELYGGQVVIIDRREEPIITAKVIIEEAGIKKENSIFSPYLKKDIQIGDCMRVFGKIEKWYRVRTKEGIIGYIDEKYVNVSEEKRPEPLPEPPAMEPFRPEKGKINMVWEHVVKKNPDTKKLKNIEGLDVVSPTWFAIVDGEGSVANNGDINYVNWAHLNGYKVWGLVSNSFNPDITHEFLDNTDKREKIISQLLIYAKLYELDGINIDFENIYVKDRDMLSQFMRELYPLCREQGLTLSIDVTMISGSENWSQSFDRRALSKAVDYMALMAYDQHWATSPQAGSVAQYKWVEKGLKRVLEEVPAEKIILGMPFYTRLWQEQKVDGVKKVSSKAFSMESIQKILNEKKPQIRWDKESGQYYAQYKEKDIIYKIWIEDKRSINLKTSLVHKYDLAGAAAWRRGFETEDIWVVIKDNLKNKEDYKQWAQANKDEAVLYE